MSSTLLFVNWAPDVVTPELNGKTLNQLKASSASFNYLPYSFSVPRDTNVAPTAGVWSSSNTLIIRAGEGGDPQLYQDLSDPDGAVGGNPMLLWIFPSFIIYSQFEQQLGGEIYPQ